MSEEKTGMSASLEARVERIAPNRAQQLLANNPRNRALSAGRVATYAAAMRRGEWKLNGEAIKLNCDGALLDGQHRLAAVVESGVTIDSLVVEGITVESQDTMDLGARRSMGDVLSLHGQQNAKDLARAIRVVHAYELTAIPVPHAVQPSQRPTPVMALEFLERHSGLKEMQVPGHRAPGFTHSALIAFAYMFSWADHDAAMEFVGALVSGDAPAGSGVSVLRERMVKQLMMRQPLSDMQRAALAIRAFNHWRTGTTIAKLQTWRGGGWRPDQFPQVEGTTFPFRLAAEVA